MVETLTGLTTLLCPAQRPPDTGTDWLAESTTSPATTPTIQSLTTTTAERTPRYDDSGGSHLEDALFSLHQLLVGIDLLLQGDLERVNLIILFSLMSS